MEIDKAKIHTQDDEDEPAPIDQVEERVEAEMKRIEGSAKERVAQGLQDEGREREGREMRKDAERKLKEQHGEETK